MTDEELIARLRTWDATPNARAAAARLEALVRECAIRDAATQEGKRLWAEAEARAEQLAATNERLEAALRFYADPTGDGYAIRDRSVGDQREDGHIILDAGETARAALTQKEPTDD